MVQRDVAHELAPLRSEIAELVSQAGYELWDLETPPGVVRVLVDRPGGVDLDGLSELAARVVSPWLDCHPELTPSGPFSLEVSSPGLERVLRTKDQMVRYLGHLVSVKTSEALNGSRRHRGWLRSVDTQCLVLDIAPGEPGQPLEIPLTQVVQVRTVLEWPSPSRPGGSRPRRASQASKPRGHGAADEEKDKDGRS